jgi:organic radical activating enzyme
MKRLVPTLSMQVTYQCNIECKHCGPYCGPHEKDWMTEDEIIHLVTQANALGTRCVVFTGGEPSLLKEKLIRILNFIRDETSIAFTRIVTNAKWATSYDTAYKLLRSWKEAGLVEVNISCGEYHQEFVPIQSVVNAYTAARDLDFQTVLLAGEFLAEGKGKYSPSDFRRMIPGQLIDTQRRSPFRKRCHGMSAGMAMNYGRGKEFVKVEDITFRPDAETKSVCDDILSAITVHPNGNTTACCGIMVRDESLLNIGNWRTENLEDIAMRASQDVILNWIRYVGLNDMKEWLRKKDPTLEFRDEHVNICDLCADLVYNPRAQEILIRDGHERAQRILLNRIAADSSSRSEDFVYSPVTVG